MHTYKEASTPGYQLDGTRMNSISNDAQTIIAPKAYRPTARERLGSDAFRAGAIVGFLVASAIFLAVLWLWVVPTMDGAVAAAKQACQSSGAFYA